MTKLQELIGLVEEASKSKSWTYYADLDTSVIDKRLQVRVSRYPIEAEERLIYGCEEEICGYTSIDNQVEMSAICAKLREMLKEDQEVISPDEIEQLRQRAWKVGKNKAC